VVKVVIVGVLGLLVMVIVSQHVAVYSTAQL
jgi:hypothetical protein